MATTFSFEKGLSACLFYFPQEQLYQHFYLLSSDEDWAKNQTFSFQPQVTKAYFIFAMASSLILFYSPQQEPLKWHHTSSKASSFGQTFPSESTF